MSFLVQDGIIWSEGQAHHRGAVNDVDLDGAKNTKLQGEASFEYDRNVAADEQQPPSTSAWLDPRGIYKDFASFLFDEQPLMQEVGFGALSDTSSFIQWLIW
ncbi:hypothetical protein G7046_g1909 [Stylonectria norvegica]|nr:hypothetical protein G7046_g1909 [Stylonectria norvegica]